MSKKTVFFKSCLGVFQGGGCRAAAYVGAVEAAVSLGVSFTEVAGTSAGSMVAAILGAGAKPSQVNQFLKNLDFAALLSPPKSHGWTMAKTAVSMYDKKIGQMIFDQGMYSSDRIEKWIESCLQKLLGNARPHVLFSDLLLPTYIVSTDLERREAKIWSQTHTPNESVAHAVMASCSIPLFFQPVDDWLVDGGVLSNLPTFVFANEDRQRPLTSRILAFSVKDGPTAPQVRTQRTPMGYLMSLSATVSDGGVKLQSALQAGVHRIEIDSAGVAATDFEKMTPELTRKLIKSGAAATRAFFEEELIHIVPRRSLDTMCLDIDELYARVALSLTETLSQVVISENNTNWVYALFPTLMAWRARGTEVIVILPEHGDDATHGPYRRGLLGAIGAQVHVMPATSMIDPRAWIFVTEDSSRRSALVGLRQSAQNHIQAVLYQGEVDAAVIQAVLDKVLSRVPSLPSSALASPQMLSDTPDELIRRLKTVGQYAGAAVRLATTRVPMDRLHSLASFVREYKYIQIGHWVELYRTQGIDLFAPAKIRLGAGVASIATPPVVEKHGDNYVLIEGTTRATYLRDNGESALQCVCVEGVVHPLPGNAVPLERVRVVGRTLGASERYTHFNYGEFRHIESKVHLLGDLS